MCSSVVKLYHNYAFNVFFVFANYFFYYWSDDSACNVVIIRYLHEYMNTNTYQLCVITLQCYFLLVYFIFSIN